ncbi:response regulator [Methylobacterium nodulans]|uniref:Response regulator receiver and SARP domain protein n=1 Tax=Methylobacterium nodulans (strain LMG 21967 / CNCM I-2342 / ORS 2060) TaxID=460265 RepID=B8IWT1_METNO|nr:response regulator receiver and SARP domain protein [Methylobacterium nodulans ORS 2060]
MYRRVLVVEDEYLLAYDLARALQKLGAFVVGPVPELEQVLALPADEPMDAAVLDVNLKGQFVFPLADALREDGVPFVFATGYNESAIPGAHKDVPRWEKPFKPEDLTRALPEIVQQSKECCWRNRREDPPERGSLLLRAKRSSRHGCTLTDVNAGGNLPP